MKPKSRFLDLGVPIATIISVIFFAGQFYYQTIDLKNKIEAQNVKIEAIEKSINSLELFNVSVSENQKFIAERLGDIKGVLTKHVEKQ